MKRTLLALLLALTLLLPCAVTVSADEIKILSVGDTVAAGQPFKVYLGDDFDGIVYISTFIGTIDGASFSVSSPSSITGLSQEDKYLFVSGDFVDADNALAYVGMELKKIDPHYKEISFDKDGKYYSFLLHRKDDGSCEIVESYNTYTSSIQFDETKNSYYISYLRFAGDTENRVDFNPDDIKGAVVTFEKDPVTLPSDPLQSGEPYYFNLATLRERPFPYSPYNPLYAAVHDTEGYTVYNGTEVGLEMRPAVINNNEFYGQASLAKLTVQAGSALDGARFTGEQYSAQKLTFTSQDGSQSIDLLVYLDGDDYKCINEQGEIQDLVCKDSQLVFNESYTAQFPENWPYDFYPLVNMVLFFDAAEMADPDEPVVPVAPSYPQYYPDYDEPATVQPAPEAPAAEADEYVVVCRRLNVRRTPSTRYARIGRISRGDVVNVIEWVGKWAKIEWKGGTAYVHGNYITPVD